MQGVTERFVTTPEEVLAVIEEGKSGRHVSVTSEFTQGSRYVYYHDEYCRVLKVVPLAIWF